MRVTVRRRLLCAVVWMAGGVAFPAWGVDGVVLIDQNRALAGSTTPGDTAGFPVTISLPGTYRLAGNLTVPDVNTDAIVITAANVTLDLNGFSIAGPVTCSRPGSNVVCAPSGTGRGVYAAAATNVTVMNGTIRGFARGGVFLDVGGLAPSRVERITATNNASTGIIVDDGLIANNVASLNALHGLGINRGYVVGNYSTNNGALGLFIAGGGYMNNVFTSNGFSAGGTSVLAVDTVNMGQNVCNGVGCGGSQF